MCVPNKEKNMNAKVFNLISGVNETRVLVQHGSYECKCRLNESLCFSKQKWKIMLNGSATEKNEMIRVLVKKITLGILVHVIMSVIVHLKLMNT